MGDIIVILNEESELGMPLGKMGRFCVPQILPSGRRSSTIEEPPRIDRDTIIMMIVTSNSNAGQTVNHLLPKPREQRSRKAQMGFMAQPEEHVPNSWH
jgi:hypothetical protein